MDDESIWSNWVPNPGAGPGKVDFLADSNGMPYDAEPPNGANYGLMRAKPHWATDSVLIP